MDTNNSINSAQLLNLHWHGEDIVQIFVKILQIAIDSVKRLYSVSPMDEIKRIKKLPCVAKHKGNDFPSFMKYTRTISYTKNGKQLPYEDVKEQKDKIAQRINPNFTCPMNSLVSALNCIGRMPRKNWIPMENFFVYQKGDSNRRQIGKLHALANKCKYEIYLISHDKDLSDYVKYVFILETYDDIIDKIRGMKISKKTMNRLIETCIGVDKNMAGNRQVSKSNLTLLTLLYNSNPKEFLLNFTRGQENKADKNT